MISRASLTGAVSAGIISSEQADKLVPYLTLQSESHEKIHATEYPHDPEEVRFTRGFHDVFISLGILMFLQAIGSVWEIHLRVVETQRRQSQAVALS